MSERINAVLKRIEARQSTQTIPEGTTALALLQMVYRGTITLSPQQIRAAIEALPFEAPKLSAMAVGHMSGQDFASRLERAIARSASAPKIIDIEPEQRIIRDTPVLIDPN